MKTASVISIGNELLDGQTVDTNAAFLGSELMSLGIPVVSRFTVGDDLASIVRVLGLACEDSEVILVTGGLGPTADDLTRQGLAAFLSVELQLKDDLLAELTAFFANRGIAMAEINRQQACLPAGTEAIPNTLGTAPGILARHQGRIIAAMPGVPFEMKGMFTRSVAPLLAEVRLGQAVAVRHLRCFGEGESAIAERIRPMMDRGRNPQVNSTVHEGIVSLHVIAAAGAAAEAERLADRDVEVLRSRLGPLVFALGDQTLAAAVGDLRASRGKTLAVAESCTGGLVSKMLTDLAGASQFLLCGWVVYSNEAKIRDLGVAPDLLAKHGAVSQETAAAMARGARLRAKADYAAAITGIAGPTGATPDKPVGLVFIGIDEAKGTTTQRFQFPRDRQFIRQRAANTALNMLRQRLAL
jgi:nicotinamide-nucleotide amidase